MAARPGPASGRRQPIRCSTSPPSTPPRRPAYTQVTDPSVGFDGQDNVYVLTLQTTGAADGALALTKFNFSGSTPRNSTSEQRRLPVGRRLRRGHQPDPGRRCVPEQSSRRRVRDPYANNVYIAWASIDPEPANTNPYTGTDFNPNRAEMVVGTPISDPSGAESLAFSGVTDRQHRRQLRPAGRFAPATGDQPERWRPGHRRLG